jgi:hypothetical protein
MDDTNQHFRVIRATIDRLERQGHSNDEAKRMVLAVIDAEEFAVMKGRHSFDQTRFLSDCTSCPTEFCFAQSYTEIFDFKMEQGISPRRARRARKFNQGIGFNQGR